jgi:hypothetical protein
MCSVPVVKRTIFIELKYDRNLGFICHWKDKASNDVGVFNGVIESDPMKSK